MTDPSLSVGRGRKNTKATRLPLGRFTAWLGDIHPGLEDWFSLHLWTGDQRSAAAWESAAGCVLDFDCKTGDPSADKARAWAMGCTGNLLYLTPNGLRVVCLWEQLETDPRRQQLASAAVAACVAESLAAVAPSLTLDGVCTEDLARFFYAPNTEVLKAGRSQSVRRSETKTLSGQHFDAQAHAAIESKRQALMAVTFQRRFATESSKSFREAAVRFGSENAGAAERWGKDERECPWCGHRGCFGRLPNSEPPRWFCWSDNHQEGGVKVARGHCGSLLDYCARLEGISPLELLKERGYL